MSHLNTLELLKIDTIDGIQRIDSRLVAEGLEIEHASLIKTIRSYQETIESAFGKVGFEIAPSINSITNQNQTIAHLTKEQAEFVTSLSRNTATVIAFKVKLVKSFNQQPVQPALPANYKQALLALVTAEEEKEQMQLQLAAETEKTTALTTVIQQVQPLAEYATTLIQSPDEYSVAHAAKKLGYGEKKLFALLRDKGVLLSSKDNYNIPAQVQIDKGLFRVITSSYHPHSGPLAGKMLDKMKTVVTEKGLYHLWRTLTREGLINKPWEDVKSQ